MVTRPQLSIVGLLSNGLVGVFGILFILLGGLKLHGVYSPNAILNEYLGFQNAIFFFLSNRVVITIAAILEIVVGSCMLNKRYSVSFRSLFLFSLASAIFAYKISLAITGYKGPCGCLLGIDRFLAIRPSTQRLVSDIFVLITLFAGMAIFVIEQLVTRRRNRPIV